MRKPAIQDPWAFYLVSLAISDGLWYNTKMSALAALEWLCVQILDFYPPMMDGKFGPLSHNSQKKLEESCIFPGYIIDNYGK